MKTATFNDANDNGFMAYYLTRAIDAVKIIENLEREMTEKNSGTKRKDRGETTQGSEREKEEEEMDEAAEEQRRRRQCFKSLELVSECLDLSEQQYVNVMKDEMNRFVSERHMATNKKGGEERRDSTLSLRAITKTPTNPHEDAALRKLKEILLGYSSEDAACDAISSDVGRFEEACRLLDDVSAEYTSRALGIPAGNAAVVGI